jgi:hypothetical protein
LIAIRTGVSKNIGEINVKIIKMIGVSKYLKNSNNDGSSILISTASGLIAVLRRRGNPECIVSKRYTAIDMYEHINIIKPFQMRRL